MRLIAGAGLLKTTQRIGLHNGTDSHRPERVKPTESNSMESSKPTDTQSLNEKSDCYEPKRPLIWGIRGKVPYPVFDYADYPKDKRPHVGDTTIRGVRISTVFLGVDHGFNGDPVLFETMIFGGEYDEHQTRYKTWDEAASGHIKHVELVRRSQSWLSIIARKLAKCWFGLRS